MYIKQELRSFFFRLGRSKIARMMQSRVGCLVSSILFFVSAITISPADINHPLWIVAIYFSVFVAIRAITHEFGATKNPALVKNPVWGSHLVFGFIQLLTAMLIFSSVITGGTSALWLVLVIIFGRFGWKNMQEIGHIFRRKELAGKRARIAHEQGMTAAERKKEKTDWLKNEAEFERLREEERLRLMKEEDRLREGRYYL